jgi:nickel/cobalt exporter
MTEPTSIIAALATAAVLGITHGIEPDHAAGIMTLTSETGNSKRSAFVGMCFAAGHVLLVVFWIAIVSVLLGVTSFPTAVEQVGTVILGVVLILLSGLLGLAGTRKLIHRHKHTHDRKLHTHFHSHLPVSDYGHRDDAPVHTHEHTFTEYLKISVIGSLFALSPPLSMIAFISVIVSNIGGTGLVFVVLTYTVAIGSTMTLVGSGVGLFFGIADRNERLLAASQIGSAVLVFAYGCYVLWQVLPASAVMP